MKYCILFLGFSYFLLAKAQSNYDAGFRDGYIKGYCYNSPGCITAAVPAVPAISAGEDFTSYQDGYNRGFQMGLDNKRASGSNNYSSDYRKIIPPPKYIPPIDLNIYAQSIMMREQIVKQRLDYFGQRLAYLQELENYYLPCYSSKMNEIKDMFINGGFGETENLLNNQVFGTLIENLNEYERVFKINAQNCIDYLNNK